MLDAALRAGHCRRCRRSFEVFTRRPPARWRRFGVFAGLARLLDALESFRFGPDELEWLAAEAWSRPGRAGVAGPVPVRRGPPRLRRG